MATDWSLTPEQLEVYNDNVRLVRYALAKYYKLRPGHWEYEDFYQWGCIGLVMAIQTFDEDKSPVFSTYAISSIRNAIYSYFLALRKAKKRTPERTVLDLDCPMCYDIAGQPLTLMDTLAAPGNLADDVIDDIINTDILNELRRSAPMTYRNHYCGESLRDIAHDCGISQQGVASRIQTERKHMQRYAHNKITRRQQN